VLFATGADKFGISISHHKCVFAASKDKTWFVRMIYHDAGDTCGFDTTANMEYEGEGGGRTNHSGEASAKLGFFTSGLTNFLSCLKWGRYPVLACLA